MKKRVGMLVMMLSLMLILASCACKHAFAPATCLEPATCPKCGETDGEALGHSWVDASCTDPESCSRCGLVKGQPLGHSWTEVSCTDSRTCSLCGITDGEPLGHTWEEATTENPKTCAECGLTEGERIITDPRFTTIATADIQGAWEGIMTLSGEQVSTLIGMETDAQLSFRVEITFNKDGTGSSVITLADPEAFQQTMFDIVMNQLVEEGKKNGMSLEVLKAQAPENFGMSLEEFVNQLVDESFPEDFRETTDVVYYVARGRLYSASSWDGEFGIDSTNISSERIVLDVPMGEQVCQVELYPVE